MNSYANLKNKYNNLLGHYFESQAFAYVLVSILFLTKYFDIMAISIFGWLFLVVSIILLLAPICNKTKGLAIKLDQWFQGGLFVASAAFVIIDGWIGALLVTNSVLFWILVFWLFLLVMKNAVRISKRLGIYKFIAFGLAAFGLLMIAVGYSELVYKIVAIIGLLLSIPALDEVLYKSI